jgi:hypothetical protein
MKPIALMGVVLIVLGIGALSYRSFMHTTHEKIADLHASS